MSERKETRNAFHVEGSILVASTAVTAAGTKKYIDQYAKDLVGRGLYTKICLLTGSHGMENGQDGMNSLECLSDANQQKTNQSQTRNFYVRWCTFFDLSVEGEDPRDYDPTTGKVTGIKTVSTTEWAARKPGRVPGLYKNMKEKMSNLTAMIIDVAHYHSRPQELLAVIEKFEPSTILMDWSFSRGGYTAQQLTASGCLSKLILEHYMSFGTGRGWLKLSNEQNKILDDIKKMEMPGDGDCHDGSIIFIQGSNGSGKTLLGIEVGRILRSKRQQRNNDTEVELTFCAPESFAGNLVETLREKNFNIEKNGNIKTVEEFFEMYQLGEYGHWETLNTLTKIGQALSQSQKQQVLIVDELSYTQDYSQIAKYPNVDMVIMAKASGDGERNIIPPASDKTVKVYDLSTSYRQSWDTFMAYKYLMTHAYDRYSLSAAAGIVPDNEGRCPDGKTTVWINCQQGVKEVTSLEIVKKVLDDKREGTDSVYEGDHVTVVSSSDDVTPDVKTYCAEQGWTCTDDKRIHGYEDDVVVILGARYGMSGEEASRARIRLIILTWPEEEEYVAALSTWSEHTAAQMKQCRKFPECPFVGEMPELERIDV